ADLPGAVHQHVPVRGPGRDHRARGVISRFQPGLHAGRRGDPGADHPDLYGLVVLGVPGQGRRGLPLMRGTPPGPLWRRLAWFVGLWLAGLAAVGSLAWLLRLWIA